MTKVLAAIGKPAVLFLLCFQFFLGPGFPGTIRSQAQEPKGSFQKPGPAERLYLELSRVGLDSSRVFKVRSASIDRPALHITLEDGTIAFTHDVMGRITGAFFEGDGEALLTPPDEVERRSMSLFTGMAILEERFSSAYFRFNDDTASELQPGLRAPEEEAAQNFVTRWDPAARELAQRDALRLLATFSAYLPLENSLAPSSHFSKSDHFLRARLQGNTLRAFDVLFDSTAGEQVEAGQSKAADDGTVYYDVWTSFSTDDRKANSALPSRDSQMDADEWFHDPYAVTDYRIDAHVHPPRQLDADVTMKVKFRGEPKRFLALELSRFLMIQAVECNGKPVEFIQNPALEGTRLARSGNDIAAIILPAPAKPGEEITLRFIYSGEVLAEAGKGLLYVGARGIWYPNRGLAMANFDMTFHSPAGWTLLATGTPQKPAATSAEAGSPSGQEVVTHWVSDRPIPVAGFDLGKYEGATAHAGNVLVAAYATSGVERDFPRPLAGEIATPTPEDPRGIAPMVSVPAPSPSHNALAVAQAAARAIHYYSQRFGPFPYSQLSLTQLPGPESQGWPGLVFLSSYAFLSDEDERAMHRSPGTELIDELIPAHEAAHQWWGDLVTWKTYRDQWLSEGLANYCALMILQEKDPAGFRQIMEKYRENLAMPDRGGNMAKDAGPVTLGTRLLSSHFPRGYDAISYGRATWLFHMLRTMLQDGAKENPRKGAVSSDGAEPFVRALYKLRQRYEGKEITTEELLHVFAEELPASSRYEGKASLDWFLQSWVRGTSLPKLGLHGVRISAKGASVVVSGVIAQKDVAENLVTSVPVYAVISGRSPLLLGRVFADGAETPFQFSAPPGTHRLLLDPQFTILTNPR